MGKCPYCKEELHIEDFYEITIKETKKGIQRVKSQVFKGEKSPGWPYSKMWVCPSCDTILGFSEWFAQSA